MKRIYLAMITTLLLAPACLAETVECNSETKHCYKKKSAVDDALFDSSVSCGLSPTKIEECIKARSTGEGEGFCNDVKLFAGNKDKIVALMEKKAKINPKAKPDMKSPDNPILIEGQLAGLKKRQGELANDFLAVGLTSEQIANILPLKRGEGSGVLKCK